MCVRLTVSCPLSEPASLSSLIVSARVPLSNLAGCCRHVARSATRARGHKSSVGAAVGTTESRGSGWLSKLISLKGKRARVCVCVCVCARPGECVLFYERSFPSHTPIALLLDCD